MSAHKKGEWYVRIPQTVLMATIVDAGTAACAVSINPHSAEFTLAFAPWPAATVLGRSVIALPAAGELCVHDVRMTTRMGRIVRYLVPAFTPAGEIS